MSLRSKALLLVLAGCTAVAPSRAANYPPGFREQVVLTNLSNPTAVRFAPDGRIFVAEKIGRIKIFDGLADATPDVLVDLGAQVHTYWDRGLLGIAVDPDFANHPYVYVLYTYNHDPGDAGSEPPHWPAGDCPDPPGGTDDGCIVNARVSRFRVGPDNTLAGPEQVLHENRWCQQFPSHSIGDLAFDEQRALYVSAGDGANFGGVDYGQAGGDPDSPTPTNPCGDPPSGRGGTLVAPTSEGGSLRAQDLRTSGDPVSFDGTVIRIDPDTGQPLPDNPLAAGDPEDDPVIAYGLRNPFRLTRRPGTSEIWIADVGSNVREEINRIIDPVDGIVENFGWPCYEGRERQPGWDAADMNLCEQLYADTVAGALHPYFSYRHGVGIAPGGTGIACSAAESGAITGLAFYHGPMFPAAYQGALFFADFSRRCLFVMTPGPGGLPARTSVQPFGDGLGDPVDLQVAPDGALYYVDVTHGTVVRIEYIEGTLAVVDATPVQGPVPLRVQLDASESVGPELSFAWDLDGDGAYDDSNAVAPAITFATPAVLAVGLLVQSADGSSDTTQVEITAGNTAPTAEIVEPAAELHWSVGQAIHFRGRALDVEAATPPSAAWTFPECASPRASTSASPGSVKFDCPPGRYVARLSVCDRAGACDTVSREIHVEGGAQVPVARIERPGADAAIAPGGTLRFASSIVPSAAGLPPTTRWNFPACASPPSSALADPGAVTFDCAPGRYAVELEACAADGSCVHDVREVEVRGPDCAPLASTAFTIGLEESGAGRAIDGDPGTFWLAAGRAGTPPEPITIDLGAVRRVCGLDYTPRQDGSVVGAIGKFALEVSTDGHTFRRSASGTLVDDVADALARRLALDPVDARFVRLVSLEPPGAAVAAAEISVLARPSAAGPRAAIEEPPAVTSIRSGEAVTFSGSALPAAAVALPASALHWTITMMHCPGGPNSCHPHVLQEIDGVDEGTFVAPDHEWYSYLKFELTATDAGFPDGTGGQLTDRDEVAVDPQAVNLTFDTMPPGFDLVVGGKPERAPFTRTVIVGSASTVGAPSPQGWAGFNYQFTSWSNGGTQTHDLTAPAGPQLYTASFTSDCPTAPSNELSLTVHPAELAWPPAPGATGYDVVVGAGAILHRTAGNFSRAIQACLVRDYPGTTFPFTVNPARGRLKWILVRGRNCAGPATYDEGGNQPSPRDPGPEACP